VVPWSQHALVQMLEQEGLRVSTASDGLHKAVVRVINGQRGRCWHLSFQVCEIGETRKWIKTAVHQGRAQRAHRGRNQRGSSPVLAEMGVTVLTYKLKRVITLLSVLALIAAVLANRNDAMASTVMAVAMLTSLIRPSSGSAASISQKFSHSLAPCWTAFSLCYLITMVSLAMYGFGMPTQQLKLGYLRL
jgi:hypothetical protein